MNKGENKCHVALVQRLFVQHSSAIRGFLLAMTPDVHLVEDLLHNVFLTATDKAEEFEEGTNFLAWTRAIAKILLLRAIRDSSRAPNALSSNVIELLIEDAPDFDLGDQRIVALVDCIDELAPKSRLAIGLRYHDLLKPAQIAARMSLKPESVSVMLSRARKTLRECIQRRLNQGFA